VKEIFPDSAAGLAVGTEVGLGVAVGPLLVGVGEGLLVGVGVGVDVLAVEVGLAVAVPAAATDVTLVVADALGVRTMIGVHVGVGWLAPAGAVVPGPGITRIWPGRIKAGLVISLASLSALALTPNRVAISDSVSPTLIV
jgi:hypothetical protein